MSQEKKSSLSPRNFSVINNTEKRTMKLYYKGILLHELEFGDGEITHANMSIKTHQIRTAKGIREAIDRGLLPVYIYEKAAEIEQKKGFPINWENNYQDHFGDEDRPKSHTVLPNGLLNYIPPELTWNIPDPHRIRGPAREDEDE